MTADTLERPPNPAEAPTAAAAAAGADLPPPPVKPDEKPKRPTTRAAREAAAAARRAENAGKPKPDKSKPKTSAPRKAALETRLAGSLTQVGLMLSVAGAASGSQALGADGVAVCQHAPGIAKALDAVAKDDPRVAAALESALTVGTWGQLVAALLPLLITVAANHGAIPAGLAAMLGAEQPAAETPPA